MSDEKYNKYIKIDKKTRIYLSRFHSSELVTRDNVKLLNRANVTIKQS